MTEVKFGDLKFKTYFLFKPEIETHEVCYNAKSELCRNCEEPECECAGRLFDKKEREQ